MAASYSKITHDDKLWVERDGSSYRDPVRMLFHGEHGPVRSKDLTDYELEILAGKLQLVLFERTGKVLLPESPVVLEKVEKKIADAIAELEDWRAGRPSKAPEPEADDGSLADLLGLN